MSVVAVEAPIVVTSDDLDAELAQTYERVGLVPGMLEQLAGIRERRWWEAGTTFADAAAMAGAKALAESGVDPSAIGLLIDTSVCRDHLEPSAAVDVHHQLDLPSSCLNFDLANACLGFINGMQLAATMIDAGQIDYALVVDGEGSRQPQEATLAALKRPETTQEDVLANFATLTLGSGGAAMVLGRASDHPGAHAFVGGVSRAATEHNKLCVGTLERMTTDSRALLKAGVQLSTETWNDAKSEFDWADLDSYVLHQVSSAHTAAITRALGIDATRVPVTFPTLGNVGPASVPITLAHAAPGLTQGMRVACMGVGSGLNAAVIEIAW
jgi:3-oxoacyl-[acyl-carrier-protein] synthase-3